MINRIKQEFEDKQLGHRTMGDVKYRHSDLASEFEQLFTTELLAVQEQYGDTDLQDTKMECVETKKLASTIFKVLHECVLTVIRKGCIGRQLNLISA